MKLLKGLSVVVAAGGLAVAAAAAASGSGHAARAAVAQSASAQVDRADRSAKERRPRELTILAGRGAEIGVSVRDIEPGDKNRSGVVIEEVCVLRIGADHKRPLPESVEDRSATLHIGRCTGGD